jgi:hypothetical protein
MKNSTSIFRLFCIAFGLLLHTAINAQTNTTDSLPDFGVSVVPSHINFAIKPGESATREIKINNETRLTRKFRISLSDFNMSDGGKTQFVEAGTGKYGLSKWLMLSPTLIELKPGEVGKVTLSLIIPDEEEAYKAAWCIVMIDEIKERQTLEMEPGDNKMAMGIIPTMGFGIYVYQNPPGVTTKKVEIVDMTFSKKITDTTLNNQINISFKNKGTGISQCVLYLEITNETTGKQQRLSVKRFTILPEFERNHIYTLPNNLEKGSYSSVAVIDYGSKEDVEAAELDFTLD